MFKRALVCFCDSDVYLSATQLISVCVKNMDRISASFSNVHWLFFSAISVTENQFGFIAEVLALAVIFPFSRTLRPGKHIFVLKSFIGKVRLGNL